MIALEISLLIKGYGLWSDCIYSFFSRACLSKISGQIVEDASNSFSFRSCPFTLCYALMSLRKFRYESFYISDN